MANEQHTPERNTDVSGHGVAVSGGARSQDKPPASTKKNAPKSARTSNTNPNATNAQRRKGAKAQGPRSARGRGQPKTGGSSDSNQETRSLLRPDSPKGRSAAKEGTTTRPLERQRTSEKPRPRRTVGIGTRMTDAAVQLATKLATLSNTKGRPTPRILRQLRINMTDQPTTAQGHVGEGASVDPQEVAEQLARVAATVEEDRETSPTGAGVGFHPPDTTVDSPQDTTSEKPAAVTRSARVETTSGTETRPDEASSGIQIPETAASGSQLGVDGTGTNDDLGLGPEMTIGRPNDGSVLDVVEEPALMLPRPPGGSVKASPLPDHGVTGPRLLVHPPDPEDIDSTTAVAPSDTVTGTTTVEESADSPATERPRVSCAVLVSYTNLTLPTKRGVEIPVHADHT